MNTPANVRALLWPALFGKTYVPGQSTICLACEEAQNHFPAYLVESPDAPQVIHEVGTFIPIVNPTTVSWLPDGEFTQSGIFQDTSFEATQYDHTTAAAGFLITQSGLWTIVSGTITELDTDVTVAAGSTRLSFRILTIHATHESSDDASQWVTDFASGDIANALFARPGPGGEQQVPRDCPGYRDCKQRAEERHSERKVNAWTNRTDRLSELSIRRTVFLPGVAAAGGGGAIGAAVGLPCGGPSGAAAGALLGGSLGWIAGGIYGAIDYTSTKEEIERAYREKLAFYAHAFEQDVQSCKENYGNLDGQCAEH